MAALLLLRTGKPNPTQAAAYRKLLDERAVGTWKTETGKCPNTAQWGKVCYTPKGLAQYNDAFGANLHFVTGAAFLALGYADYIDGLSSAVRAAAGYAADTSKSHRCWARGQMRYILGAGGRSYVIGYGNNYPKKPRHKSSCCSATYSQACDWSTAHSLPDNRNMAVGGLVGGPNITDTFVDMRWNDQQNEPKTHWSASLIGADPTSPCRLSGLPAVCLLLPFARGAACGSAPSLQRCRDLHEQPSCLSSH
jgi:hypothetical protein